MNSLVERELPLLEQTLSLRGQLLDLLIFCGKASVYLRFLGEDFPEQWRQWIG